MTTRELDIGGVIRDARLFDLERRQMQDDEITRVVNELFDLLAARQVEYVVVGGIAMLFYIEGRNTRDIDLILALADLQNISEMKIMYEERDFARADFRGLQIDILQTQNKFFSLVQNKYTAQNEFQNHKLQIATPEGLVLLKLYALPSLYRQGIFDRVALYETDITMLMQRYPMNRDKVMTVLKPFLSETDMNSLQDILDDIEKRIRRFRERPSGYVKN